MIKFFNLIFIIFSISISSLEQEYSSSQNKFSLLVHKTPTCGCCKKWVKHLEDNSFSMMIKDHQNLQKIKTQYSIKPKYQSCHTAVSKEGYIFEGHIPSKFIKNFLEDPEPNAIGLSVPGMPLGSPGMEVEGRFMPYDVLVLYKDGSSKVYAEIKEG
jgi:hypothetical protein|tara:strand:+ start:33 stop:503 length:471 start_codon:yes stop_codon:yes gene_type:complete